MNHMKKLLLTAFVFACTYASSAVAGEFDFKDPKGVNTISFYTDSPLEPIMGIADNISGTVSHDATGTKGTISFPTANLKVASKRMTDVMHGADWLDAATNETVSFTFTHDGENFEGKLTLAGITKDFTAPGKVTLIEGGAAKRGMGEGDLLVLRSKFTVSRSDFGIKPGAMFEKVGDKVDIIVAIVGYPAK